MKKPKSIRGLMFLLAFFTVTTFSKAQSQITCPYLVTNTTSCQVDIQFEWFWWTPGMSCYCPGGCGPLTCSIPAYSSVQLTNNSTCCAGAVDVSFKVWDG